MKTETNNVIGLTLIRREFKFRAWNISNRHMYYGVVAEKDGKLVVGVSFETICKDEGSVVMQFTGLIDINDNEIYEGDICLVEQDYSGDYVDSGFCGIVQFDDGEFGVVSKSGKYESIDKSTIFNRNIKVIGNVFESPELLTG